MWRPYGNRVELEGGVDPETLTNAEALRIFIGANNETLYPVWEKWYDETDTRPWYAGILDLDLSDHPDTVELLVASAAMQQQIAEQKRDQAFSSGAAFSRRLSRACVKLNEQGLLNQDHLDAIESWLIAPDGQPYIQYTPMTHLEYARLAVRYDGEEPQLGGTDNTDFSLGIIRSASGSKKKATIHTRHNKVHEFIHALSGLEVYDVTREDGLRWPHATVIGVFADQPSTKIEPGDDFSNVENVEICEGWTDFIARRCIEIDPKLGRVNYDAKGYINWAATVGKLSVDYPDVYKAITDATLAEACPGEPGLKRYMLDDMHAYADKRLGEKDSLQKIFLENGGSILDVHTKGKKSNNS